MPKYSRYVIAAVATIALHAVSLEAQKKKAPALDADIDTTYTLSDGRQFSTHGHYYRSQDGHLREDSPLGAIITDIKSGTITMLNFETREAHVSGAGDDSRPKPGTARPRRAVRGSDSQPPGDKALAKRPGETHESWTDRTSGCRVLNRVAGSHNG
jgi:hypothetical protein